jgi:hypothetical protein
MFAEYAFFAALACAAIAYGLKRREERKCKEQEERFDMVLKNIPESWFEKRERAGFTAVGTLLLLVGMSLPMVTLAVALKNAVGVN